MSDKRHLLKKSVLESKATIESQLELTLFYSLSTYFRVIQK